MSFGKKAVIVFLLAFLAVDQASSEEADILNPGPQLPTFPTNTGTLPQGDVYLEVTPFSYEGGTPGRPGSVARGQGKFFDQFLAHVGITNNLELRFYGSGFTWNDGHTQDGKKNSNFAPLSFSSVYKFWGEGELHPYVPAFAVEASVNTQWLGNSQTNSGTNPGLQFAFSKDLFWETNLNISLGPMRLLTNRVRNGYSYGQYHWDFLFQWALQKDIIDNELAIFAHGYYNGTEAEGIPVETNANSVPLTYTGKAVIGGGLIWTVTQHFSVFGQISGGLNNVSPAVSSWTGFAVAF